MVGGGLFFGFWIVLQRLSIGLVMVLVDCGGFLEAVFLGCLVWRRLVEGVVKERGRERICGAVSDGLKEKKLGTAI